MLTTENMEALLFTFLCKKYVQRADAKQKAMGLQYTMAETSDLAKELARYVTYVLSKEEN